MALTPLPAAAGPWSAPEGSQTIARVWIGDEDGRAETEAQIYREERGPWGAQVTKLWAQDDTIGRTFEASMALRRPLSAPFADAAALEGGVIAIAREGLEPALGAEGRLSAGWGFGPGLFAVAVADVAARAEQEGVSPRWTATLGRSDPQSLAFVQVRYQEGPPGRGFERAEAVFGLVWRQALGGADWRPFGPRP